MVGRKNILVTLKSMTFNYTYYVQVIKVLHSNYKLSQFWTFYPHPSFPQGWFWALQLQGYSIDEEGCPFFHFDNTFLWPSLVCTVTRDGVWSTLSAPTSAESNSFLPWSPNSIVIQHWHPTSLSHGDFPHYKLKTPLDFPPKSNCYDPFKI